MDSNTNFVSTNSSYRLSRFSLVSKPKRVLAFIMFFKGRNFTESNLNHDRCDAALWIVEPLIQRCDAALWIVEPLIQKSKPVAVAAHSKNCLQSAELLVYYQHRKLVSWAYQNTGHFASRGGISRDAGHMGRNTGCPGKYGTVGNPTIQYLQICVSDWHEIWQAAADSNRDFVGGLVRW